MDWLLAHLKHIQDSGYILPNLVYAERPYSNMTFGFERDSFDLICVDGRDRVECCLNSMTLVKPGGYLLLDNSERRRYGRVFDVCKDAGWKLFEYTQEKPDSVGFMYKNWKTSWWEKPRG